MTPFLLCLNGVLKLIILFILYFRFLFIESLYVHSLTIEEKKIHKEPVTSEEHLFHKMLVVVEKGLQTKKVGKKWLA